MLRQAFNRLFLSLPSFVERYPDIVDVVRSLYFPPKGEGMFAFVEFVDDVLTTTAMQMSGFELQNRSIRIGRPQSYEPPHDGELAGLDVQPLREKGLLPAAPPGEGKEAKEGVANVLREGVLRKPGHWDGGRGGTRCEMKCFLSPSDCDEPVFPGYARTAPAGSS